MGVFAESVATKEGAQTSIARVDDAIVSVNAIRANFGALQNRLQSTVNNISVFDENLSAANSRIRDTDVAAASADLAKNQVLLQASTATLSQANGTSQLALQLLG